jgi:RimJ/RimL family protein N-acetyltransferase
MQQPTPRVTLRNLTADDLPLLFEYQRDPEANRMAAFTPANPDDRAAFDRHWQRVLNDPAIAKRAIEADGELAGSILLWRDPDLDAPEVTYWLGRSFWGRGIATAALQAFLDEVASRPLYGRAASTNPGSVRVLEKCGFRPVRVDRNVQATSTVVDEQILRLD